MNQNSEPGWVIAGSGPFGQKVGDMCWAKSIEANMFASLGYVTHPEWAGATVDEGSIPSDVVVVEDGGQPVSSRLDQLGKLASVLSPDSVLLIYTATEVVCEITSGMTGAANILGVHQFAASRSTQYVEVVPGLLTSDATVKRATQMLESLGLAVTLAPDRPGFLLDGLVLPYLNQAIAALEEGLASAADIDTATRLGLGYPRGPLALLDGLGLDDYLALTKSVFTSTGDRSYFPPSLLSSMVAAGWIGEGSPGGLSVRGDS